MAPQDFPPLPNGPKTRFLKGGWIVVPEEPGKDDFADASPPDRARALREKADEVRKAAEHMIDDEARRSLTGVAVQFERLADNVDRQQDHAVAADDD